MKSFNMRVRDELIQSLGTPVLALLVCGVALAQSVNYDIILRKGTIVDGTGAKGFRADIAVRNGFIDRIGDLNDAKAAVDLDVSGLVVAPGFLNIHSHATPVGSTGSGEHAHSRRNYGDHQCGWLAGVLPS